MRDLLPSTSFVEFPAPRLVNGKLVWSNGDIARGMDLEKHGFCQPHPGDLPAAYLSETRVFLGERYGGRGVGSNGGGVRCGLDGDIQIKGIGRNPLVGRSTEFWHSHGGATLEEAIREAVWGEVCHRVLPFGGVRSYGIITTGTQSHFENSKGERTLPRALILRQAALRPAHYMRAINFDPLGEMVKNHPTDSERTRAAVHSIARGLAPLLGFPATTALDAESISAALMEMVRRFAWQAAASRAKRMPHGALNCSNIALDGRYLDYETISAVSDHGRVITAKGNPDVWRGHTSLVPTLIHLMFYLRNYLPENIGPQLISADRLVRHYLDEHDKRLSIEFVKLTGIREIDLARLDAGLITRLWNTLLPIMERGNSEPFKIPQMPAVMGAFHLGSIMQAASLTPSNERLPEEIGPLLKDDRLRQSFCAAYGQLRDSHLNIGIKFPNPQAHLDMALNACRLNAGFMELCHPTLERRILDAIDGHDHVDWVSPFIEDLIDRASMVLSDHPLRDMDIDWYFSCANHTSKPAALAEKLHQLAATAHLSPHQAPTRQEATCP